MRASRDDDSRATFDARPRPLSLDPGDLTFLVNGALRIAVEHPRPGVAVMRLAGEVDMATVGAVRDRGDALLASGHLLIIDMGQVSFLGSTGLGTLFALRETARRNNTEVRLSAVDHRAVSRALLVTGIDALFSLHRSIDDALADRPASV